MSMLMQFLAAGFPAGVCSGLFGIGGGLVLVPVLLVMLSGHAPPQHLMLFALGTSLASIVFSCASSAYGHWKRAAPSTSPCGADCCQR